ncbi:MAG: TonB-dependent receptor [Erythrobacter sp.]
MAQPDPSPSDRSTSSEVPAAGNPIIVTARRRPEELTEAPVALSLIGSDQIERLDMRTLEDVTLRTPGVQFTEQATLIPGRVNTAIRFRGMDTNQPVPSQQVGTIFLDGIYVATGVQSLDLNALERIEVIKGPQSATFGRSTFGGAINYVMKTPSFTPQGRVSASIAEYGTYDIALSHEGPLIGDVVAYRMGLRGFGTDGQYTSIADGGRLGQERTLSGNLTLYAEPSPDVRIKLRGFYGEDRDGQNDGIFLGSALSNFGQGPDLANCNELIPSRQGVVPDFFCGNVNDIVSTAGFDWEDLIGNNTRLTPATLAIFAADEANGRPKVSNVPRRTTMGLNRDQLRLAGTLDWDINGGGIFANSTISFLAGYNRVAVDYVHDFDHAPVAAWLEQDPQFDEDYSFEARWSSDQDRRLRLSLGVSYLDILHVEGGSGGVLVYDYLAERGVPTIFGTPTIDNPVIVYSADPVEETGETLGIFGYIGFDITDRLTLDLEGRWQRDTIGQGADFEATFENFLPRVTLSFEPVDDGVVWATYSKGNLPGFFNAAIPGLDPSELEDVEALLGEVGVFNDEEELKNYEIGWRQGLADGAVNFSIVGYFMEWTNQKTRVGVPVVNDTTGQARVLTLQTNAGNSELWGIEFEGSWRANDQLSGSVMVNWARGEYTEFTCPFSNFVVGSVSGRADCEGNTPPKFPEWSGSFAVNWEDQLNADWDYFITADGLYLGKAFNEEANFSWIGDTFRANLRAGVRRDNLRLEAFATNLFDNDDLLSASRISDFTTSSLFGFSSNFGLIVTPPQKRTIGVRATFDF